MEGVRVLKSRLEIRHTFQSLTFFFLLFLCVIDFRFNFFHYKFLPNHTPETFRNKKNKKKKNEKLATENPVK